ncbi:Indigoidine synthase A like protein-domain-containing protein [Blastocladiella britannica]|nr:Indigoidine synthase A like protein-domain-containing protein [Blastocladiella britannica]
MTLATFLLGRVPRASVVVTAVLARRAISTSVIPATKLHLSPRVRDALAASRPVVALESTIITHGMPYPANVETARAVESIIRSHGAEPATIAIMDGNVHVGLDDAALERLGQLPRNAVTKTSRRDFAPVLARGGHGATTVAGTMVVAAAAGIDVFVTGGIGGVHRGAEETWDVSADLTELGRTPVTVVCAGVKSILDVPKTLEYLETQGVTVTTHAPLGADFPAFYTPSSGLPSPNHSPTIADCAGIVYHNRAMRLDSGVVVAVPIPTPTDAAGKKNDAAALIQRAVDQAVAEAEERRIKGKDATPFLLARVAELTGGQSLAANIALILNNAAVGAQIAVALAHMKKHGHTLLPQKNAQPASSAAVKPSLRPVVVGGLVLDITATTADSNEIELHSSYKGTVTQTPGGVARNVAEAMHRLGTAPILMSTVGDDVAGTAVRTATEALGMSTEGIVTVPGARTAVYNALHTADGELVTAVADMDVLRSPDIVDRVGRMLDNASLVVVDGNLGPVEFAKVALLAHKRNVPAIFEPTSVVKATTMPWATTPFGILKYTTPNLVELKAMANTMLAMDPSESQTLFRAAAPTGFPHDSRKTPEVVQAVLGCAWHVTRHIPRLLIKCGDLGAMYIERCAQDDASAARFGQSNIGAFYTHPKWTWASVVHEVHLLEQPKERTDQLLVGWVAPSNNVKVVNVTGAGDTLVGAFAASLHAHGDDLSLMADHVARAVRAAEATLASPLAVSEDLGEL